MLGLFHFFKTDYSSSLDMVVILFSILPLNHFAITYICVIIKINNSAMFTHKMKLAEVVQTNFNTLSVINRFGIKLGFGDKSVAKVCSEYGINADFFLEILNAFHDHSYFPQKHLQSFSVAEIVEYLRKTHSTYIGESVPYIESLMEQLIDDYSNPEEMTLVQKFFNEYRDELFKHLTWEDEKIFPYALKVEEAFNGGGNIVDVMDLIKQYSMNNFLEEHDDVEEKLYDIKTLFIKYLPPLKNQELCVRIIREFSLLENDINDHARIEEKVLAPKVMEMEKHLLQKG